MRHGTYAFVYDEALSEKRHERQLAAFEARLTSLGLSGQTVKLAMFRSAKETIESMVKHGVTTIVIVGNDQTLNKVMWFLPDLDVTLGYLPVFGPSDVGGPLGIPQGVEACEVLAARRVETVDVGICDDRYFLTEAKIVNTIASVNLDGKLSLSPITGGTIIVRNLDIRNAEGELRNDAKDGLLEVIVKPKDGGATSRWRRQKPQITKMYMREGEITSPDPVDMYLDGHVTNGLHFRFGIAPHRLKIIAGRTRRLSPRDEILPSPSKSATLPAATIGL